ncbi:MAG: DUF1836 domain-containing protein [Clostridiales bacterium]|nr:DUF1836 domain-containing protein [Clostridiales bacterium]
MIKRRFDMLKFKDIKYEDIPEIELYMDQVTSYLENRMKVFKEDDNDKILTKTMINNYVKAGIIEKPIKKKYNRDHMAKMIMVYFLKNIISINDIEKMFEVNMKTDEIYRRFNDIHKKILGETKDLMSKDENQLELLIYLLLQADINKRLAEEIINEMK